MDTDLRIGIVGAGFIADIVAAALLPTSARLVAVASRRPERAEAFAQRHDHERGGVRVFESWRELVAWDGLDAVYVATPTAAREPICVAAALAGKHVLADKPFVDLPSLQRITAACRASGVAFMDGTHFVHHPRTAAIKRQIATAVGTPHSIASAFCFPSPDRSGIRFDPASEPTGAFGDMAWYSMRAVVEFAAGDTQPVGSHTFASRDAASGAIVRAAGVLRLASGCTATWDVDYTTGTCLMDLAIRGPGGALSLDDFVLDWASGFAPPEVAYTVGFTQRTGVVGPSGFARLATPAEAPQVVSMMAHFVALTRDPQGEAARASIEASERTQRLLEAAWETVSITTS